ncbi:helix-turn-helix domain-containing protein [Nonomuraea endophytica]|uniref:Excisionase family DNA binding protein n=1 Tax=Nonomuraea endophytica TaxID=714136 RepID=A0A7W8A856_9ACTN|nr:helix-turn-helix domain-containing protein [Nonomuraea endophytica]MBB5081315.1 excisionase family DNA binding protein [Nonomuraea endophytica]
MNPVNDLIESVQDLVNGILDAAAPPRKKLFTVQEAALAMRVSPSTVLGLIRDKSLANISIHKKSFRIPRQALRDHLFHRYVASELAAATQELALVQLELKRRKAELDRVTKRLAQASDAPAP